MDGTKFLENRLIVTIFEKLKFRLDGRDTFSPLLARLSGEESSPPMT